MSKYYSITREQVTAMIEEVNESITAVDRNTVTQTAVAIQDSLHEDCIWAENDADVTFASLRACVVEYLDEKLGWVEAVCAGEIE
jgi:hypothetical protein